MISQISLLFKKLAPIDCKRNALLIRGLWVGEASASPSKGRLKSPLPRLGEGLPASQFYAWFSVVNIIFYPRKFSKLES